MSDEVNAIVFETCLPIEEHARTVMKWRNDSVTLSMSFHRRKKVWATFWPEYQKTYFPDRPALHPVFAVLGGQRFGFLKFSPVEHPCGPPGKTVDISINIAPEWRGRGLGRKVVNASLRHLRAAGVESVHAEVLAHNEASIRTFQAAGFRSLGPKDKLNPESGAIDRVLQFATELCGPPAVLFDLDGTLADSLSVLREAYYRFLEGFQIRGTDDEFAALNGPPLSQIVRRLMASHGLPGSIGEQEARYLKIIDQAYGTVAAMPGAAQCLEKAGQMGRLVGVVTSNSTARCRAWLKAAGLSQWVDIVVSGDDVKNGKPDPEAYLLAARRTGYPPSSIVAVEDSPQGARAALAAGLRSFLLVKPDDAIGGPAGVSPIRALSDLFDAPEFADKQRV